MRVVIVSKTFVADTAQRQLEWLARQPDIELTLVTPSLWRADDGRPLPFISRYTSGYQVCQLPVAFSGRYHRYCYRGLGAALHGLRPDLIHIDEEPYNPAAFQAQWLAQRMGIPTVLIAWQNIHRSYPLPFAWLERYNYRYTAHMIAGNAAAGAVARRKGYRGPLSVFSVHGVDPDLYVPTQRPTRADEFVIGSVGRLAPEKGVDLLIAALAELPAHCRLRIVGGGPAREALRRLAAERGVAARVEWLTAVPASQVPAVLAGVDALALPSRTRPNWMEQFGRILIEAMACGVPVVGAASGEIPRVIGDAGLIVPEGDASALADALRTLAARPDLRQRLAERGRGRALAHFTQERVAQRLAAVYASVAGGPAPYHNGARDAEREHDARGAAALSHEC